MPSLRFLRHAHVASRALGRTSWRALPRALPSALCAAVLALAGACAPDTPTAPPAVAPTALRRLVVPVTGDVQVSASFTHTCALTTAGTVTCLNRPGFPGGSHT